MSNLCILKTIIFVCSLSYNALFDSLLVSVMFACACAYSLFDSVLTTIMFMYQEPTNELFKKALEMSAKVCAISELCRYSQLPVFQ